MKVKSFSLALVAVIGWQFLAAASAQEFSNDALRAYAKKAAVLVTDMQPTGDPVLAVNYFLEAFRNEYKVLPLRADGTLDQDAEPATLSITQDDKKLVVCTLLAETMLEVAQPDDQTPAQYLGTWITAEGKVLDLAVDKQPLLDVRIKQAWRQMLLEWRDKAVAKDSDRFRDALRQAAYSLVRAGLDIEKEHVDRVLAGNATPAGGSGGSGSAMSSLGYSSYGFHHVDVHHERMMNGIYRRHDRRMYKIDRIQARR